MKFSVTNLINKKLKQLKFLLFTDEVTHFGTFWENWHN